MAAVKLLLSCQFSKRLFMYLHESLHLMPLSREALWGEGIL